MEKRRKVINNSLGNIKKTNCFISLDDIEKQIKNKRMDVVYDDSIVVIVDKRKSFLQIYYFLDEYDIDFINWEEIKNRLTTYKDIVINVVGKNISEKNIVAEKLGFSFYKKYVRKQFINKEKKKYRELMDVLIANQKDCEKIYDMLYSSFDVLSDDLVNKEELKDMINQNHVLKIEIQNEIQGVFLYEDTGVRSYARAICIAEKYRNNVLGYSLFAKYNNLHVDSTKIFSLWVDQANDDVLKLHNTFGYVEDGLENYIYVREKDDCCEK
ncbi:MAG: hypothetical protein Q4D51_00585 [Eubacteriales bacterium]|nr:hypothetical protein [Eubacteriales bacterium]